MRRLSGLSPPLLGVRKIIEDHEGWTIVGPVRARFDVVGNELRYRGLLKGLVDVLEQNGTSGRVVRCSEGVNTVASVSST